MAKHLVSPDRFQHKSIIEDINDADIQIYPDTEETAMKTKAAILTEPGRFELQERELHVKPGEVLIKVAVCGLCNWELNHFKGLLGETPMTLGHEWAGTVEAVGEGVTTLHAGDKVAVLPEFLEGFAQYAVVEAERCFLLNDDIDVRKSFLEPLKCIVTVLKAAAPKAGDCGVIVGCGPMGLWCLQGLKANMLTHLIAVDIDDEKLEMAKRMGATDVVNSRTENAAQRIAELTGGHLADFVIEGTGLPQLMETCADYIMTGSGRLCIMSYYERNIKELNFKKFLDKGTTIYCPHPGSEKYPLDAARRAADLINHHIFVQDELITHTFRLDEIQEAFETLANKPKGFIKGVVYPND